MTGLWVKNGKRTIAFILDERLKGLQSERSVLRVSCRKGKLVIKMTLVYFHGYNSSPNSDKVRRLREVSPDTYAYEIDVDPRISLPFLREAIRTQLNKEAEKVVFVGTSLGGWYAEKLAEEFGAKCVVINPCYWPSGILRRYELPETILDSYADMKLSETTKFFISSNDEVIDFSPIRDVLMERNTSWFEGTSHRFNGPEFEAVVDYVREL